MEGWWDSNGEQALGHRKSLRAETVLAAFSAVGNDASHWSPVVVTKKITVDESVPTRTLAFVGAGTRSAEAEGGTEGIPGQRQLPSAAAVEVAVQAPQAQQDSLLVSSWP